MTRTKQTARRLSQQKSKPQTSNETISKARKRRVSQNISVLRKIRKEQEAIKICIAKAPFIRVIKQISDLCKPGLRWGSTALACVQETCEDYLIEYFNDTCILAAHAHRVTVMWKDFTSLAMLRSRYEKFRHEPAFVDKKMRDILLIPPARLPKEHIRIEEITHDKETRSNQEKIDKLKRVEKKILEQQELAKQLEILHRENILLKKLEKLGPSVEVVICTKENTDTHALRIEDIDMLKDRNSTISDTIVFISLCILKAELQEQYQTEVFILDSHISFALNSRTPPKDLIAWFTYCPIDARLIIFPYCSSDHWSLSIIDIKEKHALYFNSLAETTHLNIKRHINLIIATVETFHREKSFLKDTKHKAVQIPTQKDFKKCGWYLLYSAKALLSHLYNHEENAKMPMQDYTECDLLKFRIDIIEKIVERFSSKSWELPKAKGNEEEKVDTEVSSEELPVLRWKRLTPKKRRNNDDASLLDAREPEVSFASLLTDAEWENLLEEEEFKLPSSNTKKKYQAVDEMLVDEENSKQREEVGEKPAEKALD